MVEREGVNVNLFTLGYDAFSRSYASGNRPVMIAFMSAGIRSCVRFRTLLILFGLVAVGCLGGDRALRAASTRSLTRLDFEEQVLWNALAQTVHEEGFQLEEADPILGKAASGFRMERRVGLDVEHATKIRFSVSRQSAGRTVIIYAGRYQRQASHGADASAGWRFVGPASDVLSRIEAGFRRKIGL